MGMMLPDGLVWIMDKLGFEWPDIDEDEVRRAADIVRRYHDDLEAAIQAADTKINGDYGNAIRGKAGPAYVEAWNANRSQNLQRFLDILPPAATGVDIGAGVIVALKVKVIVDVTSTAATIIGMLTNPFTAPGVPLVIMAKKKLLNMAVDMALEELMKQILPMVIEPLTDHLPGIVSAVLDAPVVESVVGDSDEFYADLAALEQAESDLELHAADIDTITTQFIADLTSLNISG